jgi:flotillin
MGIFTIGKLGRIGMVSALFAVFFLTPRSLAPYTLTLAILLEVAGLYLKSIWAESEPNQWMLVIRNGELKKSGIGLKTLVWPGETVVKFPSAVERVEFSAKNVTREMLGVEVEGVAFWSVNRKGQGPFNCYKYMHGGGDANNSVRTVCESIVRNEMANCSLQEVLRERIKLKERMRRELQAQLDGWGIWLESVDLKDVRISSSTLFEDLQAEFRLATNLKAEQIRLATSERVTESTLQSEIKVGQATQ